MESSDSFPLIRNNLVWRIIDGTRVHIRMDPWTGGGARYRLPRDLILLLNQRDITVIAHITDHDNTTILSQGWKSADALHLPPQWHRDWQEYIDALIESHIRILEGPDELRWSMDDNGIYTPKAGYLTISSHRQPENPLDWWHLIWKINAPSRTRLFFWCVLSNKVPTGDLLTHQSFQGPSWYVLCKQDSETSDHLFLKCDFSKNL